MSSAPDILYPNHPKRIATVHRAAFACIAIGAIMLVFAFVMTVYFPGKSNLVAQYSLEQCQRVALIDRETGWHVTGAEDLALDARGSRIFVSAYDRRKTEAAVKRRKPLPQGGIYSISIENLLGAFEQESRTLMVSSLVRSADLAGGLHPHGISFDETTNDLVFINRHYLRDAKRWQMQPMIERVGADGAVVMDTPRPVGCSANNLTTISGETFVSFDHGGCGMHAAIEDVFGLNRSRLQSIEADRILFSKVGFANGVTKTSSNQIALAATRENAVHVLSNTDIAPSAFRTIEIPGGPDNLTLGVDGEIVAAVHSNLLRMGIHRKLGMGRAPSRIVRINIDTGKVEILLDDPKGEKFMAATVGIQTGDALVVGSVTDSGLLVCQK